MHVRMADLQAIDAMIEPRSTSQILESMRIGRYTGTLRVGLDYLLCGHVTAAGHHAGRGPVHVQAPHGTLVTIVRAQALPVGGPPDVRRGILRAGEQQVALAVVLDLCYRSVVALQQQRFLQEEKDSRVNSVFKTERLVEVRFTNGGT